MIDPVLLRENPELVRESQRARRAPEEYVDEALQADAARRAAITEFEALRAEQNAHGKLVAKAPAEQKQQLVGQAQELAARVRQAQARASAAGEAFDTAVRRIGNIIVQGVPAGGEEDFVVLREVGRVPSFPFPPRDHLELGERLGGIDMARGAKVSGARFYYLKGDVARLEMALISLGLDLALSEGFVPVVPPTLVKPEIMGGTGFLGEHAAEVYYLPDDELYLTGTSEVALAGLHSDEIVDLSAGPLRYAGVSTCYRREAGSHGKDTRGIIRVHQFQKLEMFVYADPAQAEAEHERLLGWQEQMMSALGLAYRVIDVAAGDLGSSAARKFDVEAWIPTQGAYRELTSTSNCTTFQARRLATRFRGEDGRTSPVATLNGTLATTRWIVALLETHQREDGSVVLPEALRPYLGGIERLEPKA